MSNRGMINNSLAAAIKSRRIKKGWSQHKLAGEAKVSLTHINNIENGITFPGRDKLYAIANALDTSPSTLWKEVEADVGPCIKFQKGEK